MPRLSIVIPCLGDALDFDGTLVSVLQHRPADCEVLVVHSQPYDDPYRLAGEVHFIHEEATSLVGLNNAAIAEASGEIIHVVGCGLEVTDGWTKPALVHFQDPEVAAVAPIITSTAQQLVSAGVRWTLGGARREVTDQRILSPGSGRLRAQVVAPTLAAGFYRRDVLAALGGFEVGMGDELADVACGLAMQGLGRLTLVEPACQLFRTSEPTKAPRSSFAAGRAREQLFWRCAAQRGTVRSLALHSLLAIGECFNQRHGSALGFSLGRAAAVADLGANHRYQQLLSSAHDRLEELADLRSRRRTRTAVPAAAQSHRKAA